MNNDTEIIKKSKIFITVGVPSSGKTTVREKLLKKNPKLCVVSQDDIRFGMLDFEHTGKHFDPAIEPEVKKKTYEMLNSCLETGNDVFFDATNTTKDKRKPIITEARKKNYAVEIVYIDIDPRLAILRDSKRKERHVEKKVIMDKYKELQAPTPDEYDEIEIIKPKPSKKEKEEIESIKLD